MVVGAKIGLMVEVAADAAMEVMEAGIAVALAAGASIGLAGGG